MQTPAYEYFSGHISTPAFGDHKTGNGSEFAYFTTHFHEIASYNKKLADEMYFTWEKAGKPSRYLSGESVVLENLLVDVDSYKPSSNYALTLSSDIGHPQSGIYLFRKKCNDETMNYMAVMSSPKKYSMDIKTRDLFRYGIITYLLLWTQELKDILTLALTGIYLLIHIV